MTKSIEHSPRHGPFDRRNLAVRARFDAAAEAESRACEAGNGTAAVASGTVKRFDGPSGFGVITADAGGGELFVHLGSLAVSGATLEAGDRVQFELREGGMGAQAVDVRAAAPSLPQGEG